MKVKVGVTAGAFDLLHTGHYLMLKEAKTQCDYLIVLLQIDPSIDRPQKNKPVESVEERYFKLRSCKYVDEVRLYTLETELISILRSYCDRNYVDIRIVGMDHKGKPFTGDNIPIPIYFNTRDHDFSTTDLRKRVLEAEMRKTLIISSHE